MRRRVFGLFGAMLVTAANFACAGESGSGRAPDAVADVVLDTPNDSASPTDAAVVDSALPPPTNDPRCPLARAPEGARCSIDESLECWYVA